VDAFSFSVQTMATIGYGAMYPRSLSAHILVSIEVLIGLLGIAMATSLMFARFSRPTARVLFSKVAVISKYNGLPTLMFRVANLRNNWIVEAQVRVSLLLPNETSPEGYTMRRLYDLPLSRSQTPFLALTWVIMHPIEQDSPLFHLNEELFLQKEYQIFVSLTGLDATSSQTIHARHIYWTSDIFWNHRFVDVVLTTSDGSRYIDDAKFHDIVPI
jgi:inward rectifier potassium channel